jgi:hypothetical protein
MSGRPKTAPPLFDARQLAETIDTIGLLVASVSDRVDAQGKLLEKVHQTATEARAAAFAAERATDWERNADSIGSSLERALLPPMARFREADDLLRRSQDLAAQTGKLLDTAMLREAQCTTETKRLWRRRAPWLLVGAVVAGIMLALLGLHVVGRWELTCGLLGGQHTYFTQDGAEACAFRQW